MKKPVFFAINALLLTWYLPSTMAKSSFMCIPEELEKFQAGIIYSSTTSSQTITHTYTSLQCYDACLRHDGCLAVTFYMYRKWQDGQNRFKCSLIFGQFSQQLVPCSNTECPFSARVRSNTNRDETNINDIS